MRIVFVQKNFHPNTVGQIKGLVEAGHDVTAIMQYVDGTKSGVTSSSLRPERISYGSFSAWLWRNDQKRLDMRGLPLVRPLVRALRAARPDIVIVKEVRAASLVAGCIARALGARVVLSWEKPKLAQNSWKLSLFGGLVLPRKKFHMGHFGEVGADIALGGMLGSSRLLPYPVEPHPEPGFASGRDGPVRIVAVGSFNNRRKRMPWLTEAVLHKDLGAEVELTYIALGSTESEAHQQIRALEAEHDLSRSTIVFNLNHAEVLRLLPTFDVLVLPAQNEPFGAVIPEAMAAGLAVVCSSTCGSRVCFEDEVSGLVFPSDSFDGFASATARLVRDAELRHVMARNAHQRVIDLLNPTKWNEMFIALLGEHSFDALSA